MSARHLVLPLAIGFVLLLSCASRATTSLGALEASFAARSYAPGATAALRLRGTAPFVRVRLYRAARGAEGPLQGAPVSDWQTAAGAGTIRIRLGEWPSGLYYARVATPGRGDWYA